MARYKPRVIEILSMGDFSNRPNLCTFRRVKNGCGSGPRLAISDRAVDSPASRGSLHRRFVVHVEYGCMDLSGTVTNHLLLHVPARRLCTYLLAFRRRMCRNNCCTSTRQQRLEIPSSTRNSACCASNFTASRTLHHFSIRNLCDRSLDTPPSQTRSAVDAPSLNAPLGEPSSGIYRRTRYVLCVHFP